MRVVLRVLWSKPGGVPARGILDAVAAKIKLTDDEMALVPSTSLPQYEKTVRSAINILAEAGWLIKNKERWVLSDEGLSTCKNIRNVEEIFKTALQICKEKRQRREEILMTVENAEERAWQQIWKYLNEMNPLEFKSLIGDLLKALNYHLDWVAPPGKNHGYIDIIAYPNPLGSSGARVKVHVKHSGQAATVEGLRAFLGTLGQNDQGIFVSSGGFTDLVFDEANTHELRRIRLISLEQVYQLWIENYDRLSQRARHRFPLKPIYFLAPEK